MVFKVYLYPKSFKKQKFVKKDLNFAGLQVNLIDHVRTLRTLFSYGLETN